MVRPHSRTEVRPAVWGLCDVGRAWQGSHGKILTRESMSGVNNPARVPAKPGLTAGFSIIGFLHARGKTDRCQVAGFRKPAPVNGFREEQSRRQRSGHPDGSIGGPGERARASFFSGN